MFRTSAAEEDLVGARVRVMVRVRVRVKVKVRVGVESCSLVASGARRRGTRSASISSSGSSAVGLISPFFTSTSMRSSSSQNWTKASAATEVRPAPKAPTPAARMSASRR